MYGLACSALDVGFEGVTISAECQLSNGLPGMVVVGLAQKSVDEAKERIRAALAHSPAHLPKKRITINLAPADLPKDTAGLDLPIIVSLLAASKQIEPGGAKRMYIGEVGLDGSVHPIRGIIGKLLHARKAGYEEVFVPLGNSDQALLVDGLRIVPVASVQELYLHLTGTRSLPPLQSAQTSSTLPVEPLLDFSDVTGQAAAKRALEIAAAGHHNVLLNGPPGTGKSMLAKALISILPPLERQAILEATQLHSLATKRFDQIIVRPPFRSPHHGASEVSLTGGGTNPRPGEISLAHTGVLFMDELPEFSRSSIEALRQPLEDRVIAIARAKDSVVYPADFILVATQNPCPCGFYGSSKPCICSPHELQRYQKKLSGPILDRIDLHVTVGEVPHGDLLRQTNHEEPSQQIAARVFKARQRQAQRYGSARKFNDHLSSPEIKAAHYLEPAAKELLDRAALQLQLSPRTYMRTIKVARTIADLEEADFINSAHLAEALQYRARPASY